MMAVITVQIQASELLQLADELKAIAQLPGRIEAMETKFGELETKFGELPKTKSDAEKFTFILKDWDGDGYVDNEWEDIISQGQALQKPYWMKAENYWGAKYPSPSGPGWHGSAAMPVIKILCVEPEYWFRNTARLPGRFQVSCPTRWGTLLRFHGDGDRVLRDSIDYGTRTDGAIAIYVEPQTNVDGMIVRPFEQTIDNIVIQALGGSLPIYLAQNQDRLWIHDTKILQHNGALVGIKHGPPVNEEWYPSKQSTAGNVWLTDPRFQDCQLEGPHSGARKQAAMLLSGANIIISGLNLYGWGCGPLLHNDTGLVISGLTMHDAGGAFYPPSQMLPYAVSRALEYDRAVFSGVNAPNVGWYLPKSSAAPSTMGFYRKGDRIL